jgi:hypothetical protein
MGWNPVAIPIAERRRQKVLLTRSGRDQLYLQLAPKAGFLPAQDPPGAAFWELDLLRRADRGVHQRRGSQVAPMRALVLRLRLPDPLQRGCGLGELGAKSQIHVVLEDLLGGRTECQETQYQSQQGPPPCSGKERGRVIGMGHRIAQRRKVRERKIGSLPSVLI